MPEGGPGGRLPAMNALADKAGCIAIALWCAACASSETPARAPDEAPKAPAPQDAASTYQRCWDDFNQRRWDGFANCYADDVVSSRVGSPPVQGRAAVLEGAQRQARAFPDGRGELQVLLVDDQRVSAVVRFHGTHSGPLAGPAGEIPATERRVGYFMLHWLELGADGKVKNERWVADGATVLYQLGLIPGPARGVAEQDWPGAPRVVIARHDDTERKNAEAVRAAYELFNQRDPAYDDYLAEDVIESTNTDPQDVVGKAALTEYNQGFIAAFPDLKVSIDGVIAAGDYLTWSGRLRGTTSAALAGAEHSGKPIDVTIIELTRWEDGKIAHSWPFLNGLEMAAQLGLLGDSP